MRTFAALALALLQAAASTQRTGIQGTIFRADSAVGERLADARVELIEGPGTPIVTRTDGAGRFAFTSLKAGTYRVQAGKDGFLREEFGAKAPDVPGVPVT